MHKKLAQVLWIATVVGLFTAPVEADDIAWSKIVGVELKSMSADQKTRLQSRLLAIANTHGCSGTLAKCISERDMTARRHAGFVARMILKGKDDKTIAKYIRLRHESAHPEKSYDIALSNRPFHGKPSAKVVLVEYACFECPLCAHMAPQMKRLRKKFGSKLAHYFKYYPVRSHKQGVPTAIAAAAAYAQGKFWPMHDMLFENRADLEESDLVGYAKKSGLDIDRWQRDRKSPSILKIVESDKLEGMRNKVDGTPTFFINGKIFKSAYDVTELEDRIAEELDILEGRIPGR